MNQPREILTSGQVTLRRWRAADADTVYQVVMQSLEYLLPWMPWASGYSHDAVRFTFQSEQDWESGVAYQYAIITDDAVVGSCGLMRRIGPGGLEIGYWLHPAHTGRGLATAATAALVDQAFALFGHRPGGDRARSGQHRQRRDPPPAGVHRDPAAHPDTRWTRARRGRHRGGVAAHPIVNRQPFRMPEALAHSQPESRFRNVL